MREPDAQPRVGRPVPFREPPAPRPRSGDPRPGFSGLAPDALATWLTAQGEPAYRASQVAEALWSGRAETFEDIHQLPGALRARLAGSFRASTLAETQVRPADGGLTGKALHRLDDERLIESVLMRYPARGGRRARATLCISSQAGCAVGCPFCATGELGFWRDLDTAEIVDQARFWRRQLLATDERVTNIVFMGMGEPLLNTDAVVAAATALSDPDRFGLGARHITISTSGVVPGIERLIELRSQYTLAVSLHAAGPVLRALLVPLEHRWPATDVVAAATTYSDRTGRRVTYEMVMIEGINDTPEDAHAAADLLRGRLAHVNLIPMNPVAHTPWQPSTPARIEAFANVLRSVGLSTTVRRNRGVDIGAACGQLAAELSGQPTPTAVARRRKLLVDQSATALQVVTAAAS
jgi:23S rRNA (adenine2503-C2)-methyltransferase